MLTSLDTTLSFIQITKLYSLNDLIKMSVDECLIRHGIKTIRKDKNVR